MFRKIKKIINKKSFVESDKDKWEIVRKKWSTIIKKNEKNTEAWIQLISSEINLGLFEDAINSSRKAQSIFPQNIFFKVLEGRAYIGQKEYEKAKKIYTDIIDFEPSHEEANLQMSFIALMEGEYEKSIKYALIHPENTQAKLYIARAYTKAGEGEKAIKYWKELLSEAEKRQEAAIQLSSIYLKKEMYEESLSILNDVCKEFPKNITLLSLQAKGFESVGKYDMAIEVYENILKISKNVNIYIKMSKVFLLQGNLERAKFYINSALEIDKDNIEAMIIDARIAKKYIDLQK